MPNSFARMVRRSHCSSHIGLAHFLGCFVFVSREQNAFHVRVCVSDLLNNHANNLIPAVHVKSQSLSCVDTVSFL